MKGALSPSKPKKLTEHARGDVGGQVVVDAVELDKEDDANFEQEQQQPDAGGEQPGELDVEAQLDVGRVLGAAIGF